MKIKRLHPGAINPARGTPQSAGLDLYALQDTVLPSRSTTTVCTGIAVAIPDGCCGQVWPRSSMSAAGLDRRAGLIDSDYRGEIKVVLRNETIFDLTVQAGNRIAQLVIVPCWMGESEIVSELDDTERGDGGFGSTGQ